MTDPSPQEIEILAEGSTLVRLFTDHPENRLNQIAGLIRGALEMATESERG